MSVTLLIAFVLIAQDLVFSFANCDEVFSYTTLPEQQLWENIVLDSVLWKNYGGIDISEGN